MEQERSQNRSKNMNRDRRGTGSGTDAETGPGQHTTIFGMKGKKVRIIGMIF